MRLVADSGLWSTGPRVAPPPLLAVLEVSGAVLSWTVDEPSGAATITFTDVTRADWLWRVLGESGHVALAAAMDGHAAETIELAGVDLRPGSVEPLRRLAVGHWLRRWWPASHLDGIAALDAPLLDAEIAALTAAAQDYFTDDTLDSDVAGLLAPHAGAFSSYERDGDLRVVELVRACRELADEVGVALDTALDVRTPTARRDEYALAAGVAAGRPAAVIAGGVASVNWSAVPPGMFDAAEDTVDWRIEVVGSTANAVVQVALSGPKPASGIPVRLRSGAVGGQGVIDAGGRSAFALVDTQPITESAAWDHDWSTTAVTVGANAAEARDSRERVRALARARLARPAPDAFLAEILAAESDY